MNVKASVAVGIQSSELREFPFPDVPLDGGILKVEAAGVCGADVKSYKSNKSPRIMGHENVGIIDQIGSIASQRWGIAEGDRVVLEEYLPCGHCSFCRTEEFRLCPGSDPRYDDFLRYGSTGISRMPSLWGGFSQFMFLHPNSVVHKAPAGVEPNELTLALPLANGYEWVCKRGNVGPGKRVVVIGPGQQGLACVLAAKIAGAALVVAVGLGRDRQRLEMAQILGADLTIDIEHSDAIAILRDITDGTGVDVVVDTAGGSEKTIISAVDMLGQNGTLVQPSSGAPINNFPIAEVQQKCLALLGVRGHSYSAVEWAIEVIRSRRYPLEKMQTHRFGLEAVDEAIRATGGEMGPDVIHVSVDPWS